MKKIIRLTENDLTRIVKRIINEQNYCQTSNPNYQPIKCELPEKIKKALEDVENIYGVKITDGNIQKELEQEKKTYSDNGKIDSKAFQRLKELLNALYTKYSYAPKPTNSNCNNLPGCVSGYRSYQSQVQVFGGKIKQQGGVSGRQRSSALPGFSQHHTGKTFDILSVDENWWNDNKEIKNWVANNCSRFGFKISYPTNGTLRVAEPWHLYYVG
jgi:hypothetical protein